MALNKIEYFETEAINDKEAKIVGMSLKGYEVANAVFTSVEFPKLDARGHKIVEIADEAFIYCELIHEIDGWGLIEKIGDRAFQESTIRRIPKDFGTVKSVGVRSFYGTGIENKEIKYNDEAVEI